MVSSRPILLDSQKLEHLLTVEFFKQKNDLTHRKGGVVEWITWSMSLIRLTCRIPSERGNLPFRESSIWKRMIYRAPQAFIPWEGPAWKQGNRARPTTSPTRNVFLGTRTKSQALGSFKLPMMALVTKSKFESRVPDLQASLSSCKTRERNVHGKLFPFNNHHFDKERFKDPASAIAALQLERSKAYDCYAP